MFPDLETSTTSDSRSLTDAGLRTAVLGCELPGWRRARADVIAAVGPDAARRRVRSFVTET